MNTNNALDLASKLLSNNCTVCPIEERCPLEGEPADEIKCKNAVKEWLIRKAGE
jgi:hypothetical protein